MSKKYKKCEAYLWAYFHDSGTCSYVDADVLELSSAAANPLKSTMDMIYKETNIESTLLLNISLNALLMSFTINLSLIRHFTRDRASTT